VTIVEEPFCCSPAVPDELCCCCSSSTTLVGELCCCSCGAPEGVCCPDCGKPGVFAGGVPEGWPCCCCCCCCCCWGVLLLAKSWPPPRIEGNVLVFDASSPLEESVVEHSLHTQHERFFPAPTSRAVTAPVPIRKAIPPATILLTSIALLREGPTDKNQENGAVTQRRKFFQENPVPKLTGAFFTALGARCKYDFRMSLTVVTITAEKASPSMVPATPNREVRRAPRGAATPPAAILAGSTMCCLCWSSKATP
jgi:hypothetical protein